MASPRLHIGVRGVFASALAAVALLGCMTSREEARRADPPKVTDLSDAGLASYTADMDHAMLALARRHDPNAKPDLWGRPEGWASLDLAEAPDLGFFTAHDGTAEQLNALLPFSDGPIRPMRPFVLKASGEDRERALKCLTEAVYYEAAREPVEGQRAVAQTVINRLRHPEYPKSVCGVVYQGSARTTGCQFSFACDGVLDRAGGGAAWDRARRVATRALSGFVMAEVGSATHFHTTYVSPKWGPQLSRVTQVGLHVFYRLGRGGSHAKPKAEEPEMVYARLDPTQEAAADAASTDVKLTSAPLPEGAAQSMEVVQPKAAAAAPPEVTPAAESAAKPAAATASTSES